MRCNVGDTVEVPSLGPGVVVHVEYDSLVTVHLDSARFVKVDVWKLWPKGLEKSPYSIGDEVVFDGIVRQVASVPAPGVIAFLGIGTPLCVAAKHAVPYRFVRSQPQESPVLKQNIPGVDAQTLNECARMAAAAMPLVRATSSVKVDPLADLEQTLHLTPEAVKAIVVSYLEDQRGMKVTSAKFDFSSQLVGYGSSERSEPTFSGMDVVLKMGV